ncbi:MULTISPECIES: GntR family transcriptional regulator [Falsihalocynthiibacter]|uniref:GntR family transcriptional regulator n=1 Tax=Falsihalocynthiibacter TaxID=2854182 RepID=UPI0030028CDC
MALSNTTRRAQSATEALHDILFHQIVSLELEPGKKISESEIASQYDVSRQPVRDAFYRLSQQGLLRIRPQKATVVTHISIPDLRRARFIRVALEKEIVREAAKNMTPTAIGTLKDLIEAQAVVLDQGSIIAFYELDELFHQELCRIAGQPKVWHLICDTKAPADRVRFLSLAFDSRTALQDHKDILSSLVSGDVLSASDQVEIHLSRVLTALPRIQANHPDRFKETT